MNNITKLPPVRFRSGEALAARKLNQAFDQKQAIRLNQSPFEPTASDLSFSFLTQIKADSNGIPCLLSVVPGDIWLDAKTWIEWTSITGYNTIPDAVIAGTDTRLWITTSIADDGSATAEMFVGDQTAFVAAVAAVNADNQIIRPIAVWEWSGSGTSTDPYVIKNLKQCRDLSFFA